MRTGLPRWWILLRELHFLIFVLFCICSPLLIQLAWMSSGLLFKHLILKLIKAKLIKFLKHHLKYARAFSKATTFLTVRAQGIRSSFPAVCKGTPWASPLPKASGRSLSMVQELCFSAGLLAGSAPTSACLGFAFSYIHAV